MDDVSPMNKHFDAARDVIAHEKFRPEIFELRQDEIRIVTGQVDAEDVTRNTRLGRHNDYYSQQAKNKKTTDRLIFDTLLDQMRDRLAV